MTETPPTAPPQYSPDGRFWWDGAAWQPVPLAVPPTTTPQGYVVTADASSQSKWTKSLPKTVQLLFAMIIIGIVAAVGIGIYHANQDSNNLKHQNDCTVADLSGQPTPPGC